MISGFVNFHIFVCRFFCVFSDLALFPQNLCVTMIYVFFSSSIFDIFDRGCRICLTFPLQTAAAAAAAASAAAAGGAAAATAAASDHRN